MALLVKEESKMKNLFIIITALLILSTSNAFAQLNTTTDTGRPPDAYRPSFPEPTKTIYIADCSTEKLNELLTLESYLGPDYVFPETKKTIKQTINEFIKNCPKCYGAIIDDTNYTQCCTSVLNKSQPANCCAYNPNLCTPSTTPNPPLTPTLKGSYTVY